MREVAFAVTLSSRRKLVFCNSQSQACDSIIRFLSIVIVPLTLRAPDRERGGGRRMSRERKIEKNGGEN